MKRKVCSFKLHPAKPIPIQAREEREYIGCCLHLEYISGGGNPLYGQAGGYFEVEMAEKSMIKDEYD